GIRDFHVTGVQTCALPILVSVTRFSFWAHTRPPSQVQPRLGSLRSMSVVQLGMLPLLVYCSVVNGELNRIVGDSRNIQLRLALACTSSLMFWSAPNQKVAPGVTCQYLTSSTYGRASRKNWALVKVALVTALLASSCMFSGIIAPLRPTRFMSRRWLVRCASVYS